MGKVLLIGPPVMEEPGAFKGDFLDSLRHHPVWNRTRFYCVNAKFFRCSDGRRLTWNEVSALAAVSEKDRYSTQKPEAYCEGLQAGSHRLGSYIIKKEDEGSLCWQGRPGPRSIRTGMAFILEDLLFLEPGLQAAYSKGRKEFMSRLGLLPKWRATNYFVTQTVLQECQKSTGGADARPLHAPEMVKSLIQRSDKNPWEAVKTCNQHMYKGLSGCLQWLTRHWARRGD